MTPDVRNARGANTSNLALEGGNTQQGLKWGIVLSRSGDTRRINLETSEGATIKDVVPVFWSELVDYPAPSPGSVVLWGLAGGLAEQPFYLGVVRPDEWQAKQSGEIRLTGSLLKLDAATKVLSNEIPVAMLGAIDDDGDVIIDENQQPQIA